MVDLIKPMPKSVMQIELPTKQIGKENDLIAAEISSMEWLVASPKVDTIAIDSKGYPFRMVRAAPRAFAIHKLWLSEQANREPAKKLRDFQQAIAIAKIIVEQLPQFDFKPENLKMFPNDLLKKAIKIIENNTNQSSFQ